MAGTSASSYTSGSFDYDALLTETADLVRSYLEVRDMVEWRRRFLADELVQKAYRGKADHLLDLVTRRTLFDQEKGFRTTPLLTLLGGRLPSSFTRQLYYLHFCLAEPLVYDVVAEVAASKFQAGEPGISKKAVEAFLGKQQAKHPEIAPWPSTTRERIVTSLLASLREFGLLGGPSGHEFQAVAWTVELVVYLLYWLRDKKTKQWLNHKHWRLLLLQQPQLLDYLRRADAEGYVLFDPAAADLEYTCGNLQELAQELVKQLAGRW